MPRKRPTGETMILIKKDRLNRHLDEVEKLIEGWVERLEAPPPFYWSESRESEEFGKPPVSGPVARTEKYLWWEEWKLWACRSVYTPWPEQDEDENHVLRRHLGSRTMWGCHAEWMRMLNRIREMASPLCRKATEMRDAMSEKTSLTEDYVGTALQVAFNLAMGNEPAKSYSQKPGYPRGVCYDGIVIEKTADVEQMKEIAEKHWGMVYELGSSEEMVKLAQEWRRAVKLQEKVQMLARKALKANDFLFACRFCRRLW